MVWSSRYNRSKPADGLNGPVGVVGLEPLPIRVSDKDEKLNRIDAVGTLKAPETTHHVEP